MAITFKYRSIDRPDKNTIKTPSIPILFSAGRSADTFALVDSGADLTAVSKSFAEAISIPLKGEIEVAEGIGGKVRALESTVGISVAKGHERYNFQVPVKVILDGTEFPPLLGRQGFFDKFVITFDELNQKVKLKRTPREKLVY